MRLAVSGGLALVFGEVFGRLSTPSAASDAERIALLSYASINMAMLALMKTIDMLGRERAVVGVEACPLQDLILWRRYRGEGAYKTNRHDLVGPVKELDARGNRTAAKDRVGYVVVKDPGLKLYQRTRAATHEAGLALRVDRTFYIKNKLLPPLQPLLGSRRLPPPRKTGRFSCPSSFQR